ncbi:bactofilin family protein [Pseudohalioglobus lutimaris]|uniref:Cell shape determination protein CcmA n=1 Tax=Pseudohalioglobus lutimaris TaxID=1737061 RepID=A0A2N5X180_9GAMM|nr:polymer-forming cytoskeletal protein [Pseudohalioglobus lutimaris]PLW68247.1 cell shape determination protein CcmA [Pseudohalioglobus lutimaris]
MLGSKKTGFGAGGNTTLVSRDTVIVGDVHFCGNLDVEGVVQGNIVAKNGKDALVRIIDKGRVQGEIRAPSVVINGIVEGDVHSSKHLELAAKGRVKGNVHYTLVEMAAGSEVNGSLTHIEPEAQEGAREVTPNPAVEVTEARTGKRPVTGKVAPVKS